MATVSSLIEKLMESPGSAVPEAGEQMLRILSGDRMGSAEFLVDPLALVAPPYFISRYITQVAWRALKGDYDTLDDLLSGLYGLVDRNPPVLEARREASADRVVIPEARVLDIRPPVRTADGWESSIDALITSGPLRDREVEIRCRSAENRTACFIVPYFWVHARFSAYNLAPAGERAYVACAETFLVLEPMRQVNATTIARSLHCAKPQFDQTRRGKGDVTIHTLRGIFVHSMFDRMLEGADNLTEVYKQLLPGYLLALASVTDEFFDEDAFRADILRHTAELKEFIGRHPHLLENTQLELRRYSATIGIQGRIDAVFRQGNKIDILELKTGARIRPEDHAQLFIYRLLLSDLIRRSQRNDGHDVEITSRLLSSTDGSFAPLRVTTDFFQVLDARNKLIGMHFGLSRPVSHIEQRYEGFKEEICGNCMSWTRTRCKQSSDIFGDRPGSLETPQLEYFQKFTRLVQRERWLADQDLADLLDDSRLEFRVKNFRAICGARIVPGAEPFTFEFDQNTSDLEHGDSVLVHAGRISSTSTYHGFVREIDTRRVRLFVPLKNLSPAVFGSQDWIIDRFPGDVTAEASHTALYDFLIAPMDAKKRVILGLEGESPDRPNLKPTSRAADESLNSSQREAIHRAVNCDVFHLIWGPPGTGKTKVIPEIVQRVQGTVLLGAFTNTAVDKMLLALLASDPAVRFLRVGRASDSPDVAARLQTPADYFTDDLAQKLGSVAAMKAALSETTIVAATAHRASTLPFLRNRPFDMAIVDEAAQLTEPLTLGLILRAKRFVLIGDDRQLPPVVRTRELARSLFERLKASSSLTLLDTQYRMHPDIMDLSNRLFYDGKLNAGITADERRPADGLPVLFVPVESSTDDRRNLPEAEAVACLVRGFVERDGIAPGDIGVVSPFRAQVVLLRQILEGTGVVVDTIERFQGGERDIMILSFVRSRGSGFVFDDRRLNVALTRARRKLVLVAHPQLFRNSRYEWISTFTETLRTAGTT